MIHDVGRMLDEELRERGCPVRVVDRESTRPVGSGRERIVIEDDLDAGDSFSSVRSQHQNPKHAMTCNVGARLTIYVHARKTGAQLFEHRDRARKVLDHVIVGLRNLTVKRKVALAIGPGRFVVPEDQVDADVPNGAAYELRFQVGRAIEDRTWEREAKPETQLTEGMIRSTTTVRLAHGPEGAPIETGCGGAADDDDTDDPGGGDP